MKKTFIIPTPKRPSAIAAWTNRFTLCLVFILFFGYGNAQTKSTLPSAAGFGFVENKGQIVDQDGRPNVLVKFMLGLRNLKVEATTNGFSYETITVAEKKGIANPILSSLIQTKQTSARHEFHYHRIDIRFIGASSQPKIVAEEPFVTNLHYYAAGLGSNGITARRFRKVRYSNLYPGIDLVLTADPLDTLNPFEYFFIVKPGANPGQIKLLYNGALQTKLDHGHIAITVASGTFNERIPQSYLTDRDGVRATAVSPESPIHVSYISTGNNEYGFHVPVYNRLKRLIIDPTPDLIWGTYYGGWGNDFSEAIAKDASNNLFICGNTDDPSTQATTGAFQHILDGYTDAVIGKFDNGGSLIWFTYYGGSSFDDAAGVKIDPEGNVVVAGQTYSPDVIATPGAYQTINTAATPGLPSAFVVKFDNNGTRIWGTYFGGNYSAVACAVATDSKSNIFITGFTESTAGVATPGAHQQYYAGDTVMRIPDAFVAKFDKNGALAWATYFGGTQYELGLGICVDQQDNAIITGSTNSPSGLITSGCWQPVIGSVAPVGTDGYLAKFDPTGVLLWATYYGGNGSDGGYCVAIDQANNIVIGGLTSSSNNIGTPGTQQPTESAAAGADYQAFVAKFTASGKRIWGTYYGNGGSDDVLCIATDDQNNIYLGGESASAVNITTPGCYQPQPESPTTNAYLAKMNSSGILQWGTFYGVPGGGWTAGIVEVADGGVVVTGITSSTTNISTCGAVQPMFSQFNDIFLGKFGENVTTHGPSISINATSTGPVCPNTPATFTATPDNGGTTPSFQWLLNGTNVGGNAASYTSTGLTNGDKVSCFLTSNSVCVTTDTATSNVILAAVITPTTPQVSISASTDTICLGSPASFTADATTISSTPAFQWLVNGTGASSGGPAFGSSTLHNGDLISCAVTDGVCGSSLTGFSNTISMTVNSNILTPALDIQTPNDAICAGNTISFGAIASNAGADPKYQWSVNGVTAGTNSETFQSSTLQQGDTVNCTITPAYQVCWSAAQTTSNTITMTIYPLPEIVLSPIDTAILYGTSFVTHPLISGPIASYAWTPAAGLSDPTVPDPIAKPDSSMTYVLTVTSPHDCEASAKMRVKVLHNLHMPNAFTPDVSGRNSIFRIPPNTSITLTEFSIYNRWGARIFTTKNANVGWDGTMNGVSCEAGTYVYFVTGSDTNGRIVAKGTVILLR